MKGGFVAAIVLILALAQPSVRQLTFDTALWLLHGAREGAQDGVRSAVGLR